MVTTQALLPVKKGWLLGWTPYKPTGLSLTLPHQTCCSDELHTNWLAVDMKKMKKKKILSNNTKACVNDAISHIRIEFPPYAVCMY